MFGVGITDGRNNKLNVYKILMRKLEGKTNSETLARLRDNSKKQVNVGGVRLEN
jgi:hypothetical protein